MVAYHVSRLNLGEIQKKTSANSRRTLYNLGVRLRWALTKADPHFSIFIFGLCWHSSPERSLRKPQTTLYHFRNNTFWTFRNQNLLSFTAANRQDGKRMLPLDQYATKPPGWQELGSQSSLKAGSQGRWYQGGQVTVEGQPEGDGHPVHCLQSYLLEDNPRTSVCSWVMLRRSSMPEMLTEFTRLTEHATNKHSKDLKDCFPTFEEAPPKK